MRQLCLALFLAALTSPALAVPTINCHCFQDRSFDPQRPAAVDPYLLANARNSLFAATFGIEKKGVVQAVMSGTPPEELWVGHYLAERSGHPPHRIEALRSAGRSWKEVLVRLGAPEEESPFFRAARQGAGSDTLAPLAVDAVLIARLGASREELDELRSAGADDRQRILALFLSRETQRPARDLYDEVAAGGSWGAILTARGMAPKDIEGKMRRRVRESGIPRR